jgi:epoxyqueuosine reductase
MDDLIAKSSMIKAEANRLGFDGCGVSHAELLAEDEQHLKSWLNNHFHGSMTYMENHAAMRANPSLLVEGVKSVISLLLNYFPSEKQHDTTAPVLSKYAYGKDYHKVLKKKMRQLLQYMQQSMGPVNGRAFVDSAPVLDRAWAARAGLGWIGKNTNLISPKKGSFFFIGTILVDIPLAYDKGIADFCGDCNRCIHACPTGAIVAPKVLDARLCISYQTIENKDEIAPSLKGKFANRVFGCDICQDVCPWNRKSKPHEIPELKPLTGLLEMKRAEWFNLNEEKYNQLFNGSAVKRAKFQGLRRNLRFICSEADCQHDESVFPPQ